MRVIVGITGGIAAYKATGIIRLLTEAGHSVKVIPTQNALRFIGATTLEALSHNSVDPDLYTDVADVKHIALAQEADLVIVAPATAAFLARYASGQADDLLGNTLLATKAPVVVAPAMHTEMWQHPATVANIETLKKRDVWVLEPAVGRLTGQDSGPGRLPEPNEIVDFALSAVSKQDLAGKKFLITAGGTQEPIDPVRFIGNHSSGKQGLAIAAAASQRGAQVTLIAANINEIPTGFNEVIRVQSAAELQNAVLEQLPACDVLVMAAAVSDFRLAEPFDSKIKKSLVGDRLNLELVQNPDVLKLAVDSSHTALIVGFAAETAGSETALTELAVRKLVEKGCDFIVANDVSNGKVFGSDQNSAIILSKTGGATKATGTKSLVANELLDLLSSALSK
ncbi:bifunctional phosphopantothenoylcysteine decarboxylase/phosphopantothenate--cysteine ligase CoaBC [Rhodoluna limnophila]|uniref:bifunctional phosphopantothenoylcysteine decarboxylase/phosphopantothenate--cysteine ligase CoaBC n=1 Tax=Rhodoluna limnophila TaxID=232537 RepID=UPI001106D451|nr:bifunctional phosphopantothenoylcysteine decarboxylase/phosphopantothenate--cysteine ligase CoaBC [Rhodoluna limnophila]